MIHVKEMMKYKGSKTRSQSMNDQRHCKQAETKTNDETRQPPTRMLSVVQECKLKRLSPQQRRSLMKETSTLGEIDNTKPHNKTPYELLLGKTPSIVFMRPFGYLMTILNTLDPLGKFDGKAGERFLVRYSVSRSCPTWLFDIDTFTKSINYQLVSAGNQPNPSAVKEPEFEVKEPESEVHVSLNSSAKAKKHDDKTKREAKGKSPVDTNPFSAAGPSNTAVSPTRGKSSYVDPSQYPDDLNMPALEDITYSDDEEDVGAEADFSNLETNINEEGIYYEEFFAPMARIKAIRLFLAYASFMGFMVYQMDVKSAFLYGTIKKQVYVCQPLGFEDPDYPDNIYKVVKALYGLHQAPRAWYETLANYLLENDFQRGKIDQTLFIKKQKDFEKLMKEKFQMSSMGELTFFLDGKSASTLIDTKKPLLKDPDGKDLDVHTYSQENFRYLKVKPYLGLWYPKDSPFNLVAYSNSDYVGESLNRKSTTRGCQFLGYRLISWQCKKQTIVTTSSTEAEYVVAASYCA
nr:putative ribonuclease H-like domain-containing protein [Tanacetum cinerariifolium]